MSIQIKAMNILESYYKKELDNKYFECKTHFDEMQILAVLINKIEYKVKDFKFESYYDLLKIISERIITLEPKLATPGDKNVIRGIISNLLIKLTILSKGQTILRKFKSIISKYKYNCIDYLSGAAINGTFLTFLFWLEIYNMRKLIELPQDLLEELFVKSIANSDDRLYKYILETCLSKNKLFLQNNENIIRKILKSLSNSNIPNKYILKRIKLLSQHVILQPYFNFMVNTFHTPKVIITLHKYYYDVPYNFTNLFALVRLCNMQTSSDNELVELYSMLKTDEEKLMYNISISLLENYTIDTKYTVNNYKLKNLVIENYSTLLYWINWNYIIRTTQNNKINKMFVDIVISNNLITLYINNNKYFGHISNLGLYSRFLEVTDKDIKNGLSIMITVNYITHRLRLLAKKKRNTKLVQNQSRICLNY